MAIRYAAKKGDSYPFHALDKNISIHNVIADFRDRPEGSQSKLNTVLDGAKMPNDPCRDSILLCFARLIPDILTKKDRRDFEIKVITFKTGIHKSVQ